MPRQKIALQIVRLALKIRQLSLCRADLFRSPKVLRENLFEPRKPLLKAGPFDKGIRLNSAEALRVDRHEKDIQPG
jgi:hypothetical protein